MSKISRNSIMEAVSSIEKWTHSTINRLLLAFGLEDVILNSSASRTARANSLIQYLIKNPDLIGPSGNSLTFDIIQYIITNSIEVKSPKLATLLRQDGYFIENEVLKTINNSGDDLESLAQDLISQEDVNNQIELLATHRRTLIYLLQQQAAHSKIYTPPGVNQGIFEARKNIREIKAVLRKWNFSVVDMPNDDEITNTSLISDEIKNEFNSFLKKFNMDWSTERDSDPINTDKGKIILQSSSMTLSSLRLQIDIPQDSDLNRILEEAAKRLAILQRHQTYIDGGISFSAFWEEGDKIINLLKRIPEELKSYK